MNLAQIRAARVRQYTPARTGSEGGWNFNCSEGVTQAGRDNIAVKVKAQLMAKIAEHMTATYGDDWENYGLRPDRSAFSSPLAHKKLWVDLTGDPRAKMTEGILFKFLQDLGLNGEVSCYSIKTNMAVQILNSMSAHGGYLTWPEWLNALFKVGPAADPPTPDPTKSEPKPASEPGKEPVPGEPAPSPEPAYVVEYKAVDDLTDPAERGIRRLMDFVVQEQSELSEDNVAWVWTEYGAKYNCIDKSRIAILISNIGAGTMLDRHPGTGHVYSHGNESDYMPEAEAILARFDLDHGGCLSASEFMAALKSIEKPRKLIILERAGLRPISQEEQVRPPPKPFKFGEKVTDMSPVTKAGLAVGTPAVMGGLLALKYGWLGFATGGVLGLAGVGAAAWTIHRVKSRTEIKGKSVDKKLVDLKDVKEQPMADNLVASRAPEMTAEIYPVHMNILSGQLEAAGYLKAAKQANDLAAKPKVSGPPEPNPEPTSQMVPGSPRQAPPPTGITPSGARSPVKTIRAEAAPFVSVPHAKPAPSILKVPEVRRDRRGRPYTTPGKTTSLAEAGSICDDAIKRLPPEVKCIVDAAIASPGQERLRHAASVLKDPIYEDRYKFVAGCLQARADKIARS